MALEAKTKYYKEAASKLNDEQEMRQAKENREKEMHALQMLHLQLIIKKTEIEKMSK